MSDATATAEPPVQQDECLTLAQIVEGIRREHEAAGQKVRESLGHARACGDLLIQAKASEEIEHGNWMEWVKEHCPFDHSTANLYMKIAREWSTLEDSEQVRNLTLRDAARLVYGADVTANEDPSRDEVLDRVGLKSGDLAGLSAKQKAVFVKEVRELWMDFSQEAADDDPDNPRMILLNRRLMHVFLATPVLVGLKQGKIGHASVRERLRPFGDSNPKRSAHMAALRFHANEPDPEANEPPEYESRSLLYWIDRKGEEAA